MQADSSGTRHQRAPPCLRSRVSSSSNLAGCCQPSWRQGTPPGFGVCSYQLHTHHLASGACQGPPRSCTSQPSSDTVCLDRRPDNRNVCRQNLHCIIYEACSRSFTSSTRFRIRVLTPRLSDESRLSHVTLDSLLSFVNGTSTSRERQGAVPAGDESMRHVRTMRGGAWGVLPAETVASWLL